MGEGPTCERETFPKGTHWERVCWSTFVKVLATRFWPSSAETTETPGIGLPKSTTPIWRYVLLSFPAGPMTSTGRTLSGLSIRSPDGAGVILDVPLVDLWNECKPSNAFAAGDGEGIRLISSARGPK